MITVEELTCLATWKDGNSRYLVGLVSHHHAVSNEERYRCFVYEKIMPSGEYWSAPAFRYAIRTNTSFILIRRRSQRCRIQTGSVGWCHLQWPGQRWSRFPDNDPSEGTTGRTMRFSYMVQGSAALACFDGQRWLHISSKVRHSCHRKKGIHHVLLSFRTIRSTF